MTKHNRSSTRILFSQRAQQIAREALAEVGEGEIGAHLGVSLPKSAAGDAEGNIAVHRFRSLTPGYPDWEWVAVLANVPGTDTITVNEVSLQAGKQTHLAPEWVPYEDRVRPGDLRPGDILPPREGDERLTEWEDLPSTVDYPRNRRARVALSEVGLSNALRRWKRGEYGPQSQFAKQATMRCRSCAFFLPLPSIDALGVCSNEYSADGHVVAASYGCGAHSATQEEFDATGGREYGAFDDGL